MAGFVQHAFEAKLRTEDPQAYASLSAGQRQQAALERLNREWLIRYNSFFGIRMIAQQRAPLHHAGWDYPADDPKMDLYQEFKRAYRELAFTPGGDVPQLPGGEKRVPFKTYAGRESPMTRTVPYESRAAVAGAFAPCGCAGEPRLSAGPCFYGRRTIGDSRGSRVRPSNDCRFRCRTARRKGCCGSGTGLCVKRIRGGCCVCA